MPDTHVDRSFALTNINCDVQPAPSFHTNQISGNIHVKYLKSMYLQETSKAQTMCFHTDF